MIFLNTRFYRLFQRNKKNDYAIVVSIVVSSVVNFTLSDGRFYSVTIVAQVARDSENEENHRDEDALKPLTPEEYQLVNGS